MGDVRYSTVYARVRDAPNRVAEIRALTDEDVISALGGASSEHDPLVANFLATEAMNRVQRGRRVIETIPEGIIALDTSGRFSFLNPAAEKLVGRVREEVVGRALDDILHIEDVETGDRLSAEGILKAAQTEGASRRQHVQVGLKDGRVLRTSMDATPVTVEGNTTGLLLTLQPRLEPNIEHGVLDAVLHATDDAVVVLTTEGIVSAWNPGAERLFERDPAQMMSRSLPRGLIRSADGETDFDALAQGGGAISTVSLVPGVARRGDGSERAVLVSTRAVIGGDGRPTGVVLVACPSKEPQGTTMSAAEAPASRATDDAVAPSFERAETRLAWPWLAGATALAAAAVASLSLVGWIVGQPLLTSFGPGLATMKANTAIDLILLSAALWLTRETPVSARRRFAASFLSILAIAIATLTLVEYATGLDLGIGQAFQDPITPVSPVPGRMSIVTALLFDLLGAAVLLRAGGHAAVPTQALLFASGCITLLSITGYVLGAPEFIGASPATTGIALPTIAAFVLLTVGVSTAMPREGLAKLLGRSGSGAVVLRRLLPAAIIMPLLVAWLGDRGQALGWWSADLRGGLVAVSLSFMLGGVGVWTTNLVRRADGQRDAAAAALVHQKTRLAEEVRVRTLGLAATNTQLSASLSEKETLLKEIHHRVKNNLQVTSSLLMLQSQHARDEPTRELFAESINRVRSMALVHEKLYQSRDVSAIDFGSYVQDLAGDIMRASGARDRGITLMCSADPVLLDLDTSINGGLIVNELVTNAIKHGFPDDRQGRIEVAFRRVGNDLALEVSDDGIGIPPDVELETAKSMGLRLVDRLAKQLDGRAKIDRGRGTRVSVTFPVPTKARERLQEMIA